VTDEKVGQNMPRVLPSCCWKSLAQKIKLPA